MNTEEVMREFNRIDKGEYIEMNHEETDFVSGIQFRFEKANVILSTDKDVAGISIQNFIGQIVLVSQLDPDTFEDVANEIFDLTEGKA